jgi:hypothetical protein
VARERRSPMAGPPMTRRISAVLPPSSETGMTWDVQEERSLSSSAMLFIAVPPEKTTSFGSTLTTRLRLS